MVVMWAVTTSPRSFPLASTSKFSNAHRRLVFFLPLQTSTHLLSLLSRLTHTPLSPPLPSLASILQHRQCTTTKTTRPFRLVCLSRARQINDRRSTTVGHELATEEDCALVRYPSRRERKRDPPCESSRIRRKLPQTRPH